jgi:hypothetical protein
MKLHHDNNLSGFGNVILLLLISAAVALLVSPAFADTGVTISAEGASPITWEKKWTCRGTTTLQIPRIFS